MSGPLINLMQHLQKEGYQATFDQESGLALISHPTLQGLPTNREEYAGYALEYIGSHLLLVEINLAEMSNEQLLLLLGGLLAMR